MANKTLTAKVKFDTKSAEASLNRLSKKINNVQNAINKTSKNNTKLTAQINKAVTAENRLNTAANKVAKTTQKVNTLNKKATASAKSLSDSYKTANRSASNLATTIKRLAATYLGVMGMKATITTSDNITSTQNKLNALNGGDKNLTQEQMDKMYVSSNKVRMNYTDMLANASKSMTLAGGAFQGNMDNAIRFQEIMAETYALGGASAPEMSNSMYQLIQALGSGQLAGDELRAVREGAPLAYQEIEKFAQKTLNSTESLKELASQGKVTSDMVVAAIMSAGDEIDAKFEETAWTFGAVWNRIKSTAVKAFEPISNQLSEMLNKVAEGGLFDKMEQAFWTVSKVIQIAFQVIYNTITWVADNWNWLQHLIVAGLIVLASVWIYQGAMAAMSCIQTLMAMSSVTWAILVAVAAVLALAYIFILWKNGTIDTCQAIVSALLVIGAAVAIIGLLIGGWVVVIIGLVIAAIGLILNYLDYFLAGLYSAISVIWNLIVTLVTAIIKNAILPLTTAWDNFINFFSNLFNDPIAAIIRCFENLADTVLSILSTIASGIDAIFGSSLAEAVEGWRDGLASTADSLVETYGNGTYDENSDVTSDVEDLLNSIQTELLWDTSDAWDTGMEHGAVAQDWLNNLGSEFQTGFGGVDDLGETLGLNFDDSLLSTDLNNLGVDGAYTIPDTLGNIEDNTASMADSMEINKDDLDYLRKVAEMEWRNEFTTAEIRVDMTNNNTVNGEQDLDGIVEYLSDVLRSEMTNVAYGVHY